MRTHLYIDCETKSPTPINLGTHAYAQGASPLLVTYALGDGPVSVWQPGWFWDRARAPKVPNDLREYVADPSITFTAHKSEFDRVLLREALSGPPINRWYCTMTQAYAHAMPASLDMLARWLGLPPELQKIGDGKELIKLFCIPPFADPRKHPDEWARFIEYAKRDIETMRACHKLMPTVNYPDNKSEFALWLLDQEINERGFAVDTHMAGCAVKLLEVEKARLDALISDVTGGAIHTGNQREKLKDYLEFIEGIPLDNLQKATVKDAITGATGDALTLLNIRRDVSRSSTAKYGTLLSANIDGRIHGASQFCGADRTGRWAGRVFQPLNLPRPVESSDVVYYEIDAMKRHEPPIFYSGEYDRCVDALRGTIIAGPGKKLIVSDYTAIEGVLLAWEAGEQWKLDAYLAGEDIYIKTYQRSYGDPTPFDKKDSRRQVGKVLELSSGYQGGSGAYVNMSKEQGVDHEELACGAFDVADSEIMDGAHWMWDWACENGGVDGLPHHVFLGLQCAKLMWRRANLATCALWKALEKAGIYAMEHKGKTARAGKCQFLFTGSMLAIRLPSGRLLLYAQPRLRKPEDERPYVSYVDSRGGRRALYGGLYAENITQANGREVLVEAMPRVEEAGFTIVLHVYDEIMAEVPEDSLLTHEFLSELLCHQSGWTVGIPLMAEGFTTKRYRKD